MPDTHNSESILVAEALRKSFGAGPGAVRVLRGLGLSVRRGEFLAIMGPSGCGKSTLLHVLGLMTPLDGGTMILNGENVPDSESARTLLRRRHIGFVFQRFNLLSVLSAIDNVAISLRVRGLSMDGEAGKLMQALGVAHVAARKPGEMSMGEQQRVAVVRALAHRPQLLLADEPTGNLDSENSAALLDLLRTINRRDSQTIIMITHSAMAAGYADRIACMKDGKIIDQQG